MSGNQSGNPGEEILPQRNRGHREGSNPKNIAQSAPFFPKDPAKVLGQTTITPSSARNQLRRVAERGDPDLGRDQSKTRSLTADGADERGCKGTCEEERHHPDGETLEAVFIRVDPRNPRLLGFQLPFQGSTEKDWNTGVCQTGS